jgi:hypothetical protein
MQIKPSEAKDDKPVRDFRNLRSKRLRDGASGLKNAALQDSVWGIDVTDPRPDAR